MYMVLKQSPKLKSSTRFSKVFISIDRTPEQRVKQKELVCEMKEKMGGGHRYLDTWIPKICQVSKKKVSKSIHEYPKVSIFVSFFVDQSHPLNQLSTSSLEF